MVKFIALYKKPADAAEFEKNYFDTHMPLVNKIPGLKKTEVTRLTGMPGQEEKYYMMAELYFEDFDKLNEGMSSAEGKAAAKNLMSFAKDIVVFINGDIVEK
jgi:uncharacterized protein (TIGR02118 family)